MTQDRWVGSFYVENLIRITLPELQPITAVHPDTAEQTGQNS